MSRRTPSPRGNARNASVAFQQSDLPKADGPVTRSPVDTARKPSPMPTGTNYPVNDIKTYRDLLIFEERLKQNMARLKKRKQKYQVFLSCLVTGIIWLSFRVLLQPSKYPFIQFLHMIFLLIAIVTLVLFFVSGLYRNKVIIASRYVPQCNRSLRAFNLHFRLKGSPKEAGELTFHSRRVPEGVRDGYARYRRSYWQKRKMVSAKRKNEKRQQRSEKRWWWRKTTPTQVITEEPLPLEQEREQTPVGTPDVEVTPEPEPEPEREVNTREEPEIKAEPMD